jgi:lipid-binding SYLF domain-containing protein
MEVFMKKSILIIMAFIFSMGVMSLDTYAGWDPDKEQKAIKQTNITIERFRDKDPTIDRFFDMSYGYAVFSNVGKGAFIVGGGYGRGTVHERGRHVGYVKIVDLSIGFQIGGRGFSEIIFFKDKKTFDTFKAGKFELSSEAVAVFANFGAAKKANYDRGAAVFIFAKGGLMADASVGGQAFEFETK